MGLSFLSEDPDLEVDSALRSDPKPFTAALKRILNQKVPHHAKPKTVLDLVAEALVFKAVKGDFQALKEIADRVEGRVPQPRPQERDGRPAEFVVTYATPLRPKAEESRVGNIAS